MTLDPDLAVHLVDGVIGLTLLEACALAVAGRTGRGLPARDWSLHLLSGLLLMLALRSALASPSPAWMAWLAAAGLAHAADLLLLWRRRRAART